HVEVSRETAALDASRRGALKVEGGAPAEAPAWLTGATLAAGEKDARARAGEVHDRLAALAQAPATPPPAGTPTDPSEARVRAAAAEATPELERALAALDGAADALAADKL